MKIGLPLFINEAILFGLTLVLGLYSAYHYSFFSGQLGGDDAVRFTLVDLVFLIVLFGAIFLASRHKRIARFSFKFFLVLVIFSGTQVVLGIFMPSPLNLVIAVLFTLLFIRGGNVLIHNLGIILGIGGIAAIFGLSISTKLGLILLVALSFYDILAVYVTKHMVRMAKSMVEGGAVFGFLIPFEFRGFFYGSRKARAGIGENFMILGSGDIGLPLIFISSLVRISLLAAVVASIFSLAGLFITHILFVNQIKHRAMAALPPIATMTIIGYLISLAI